MTNVIKIALPSYNATTDTNPDHFALYTDGSTDHILIKEYERGSETVSASEVSITHNFGYVPLFFVFVYRNWPGSPGTGWVVPFWPSFSVDYYVYSTTTKLSLNNATGTNTTFRYYIFYDKQIGTATQTITESKNVLKVAKLGKSITSTDPNDYIFHSDLNTFKIINKIDTSINVTSGNNTYTIAHGLTSPSAFTVYFKFGNNVVINDLGDDTTGNKMVIDMWMDATNINITTIYDSAATLYVSCYIFETPL